MQHTLNSDADKMAAPAAALILNSALTLTRVFLLVIFTCLLSPTGNVVATPTNFPTDSGLINITAAPYYADNTGATDVTSIIIQAIRDANASTSSGKIIYFPNGTYLVSNTLDWKNAAGAWCCDLSFMGQERALTIIKLANNAAGFTNPATPKAVIYTASIGAQNSEQAFNNNIMNLTVDVGQNNTGAVAIDYMANNIGAIRDVTIKSSDATRRGYAGILMTRDFPGPCLITNVSIDGFNYGISIDGFECGVTFEHITLTNQSMAGILNSENILSIRDLQSTNSVVAINNTTTNGLVVLIGSSLNGGSAGIIAISNSGKLLLRDVTSSGYASVLAGQGSSVTEYTSHEVEHAFTTQQLSTLRLPIEETPATYHSNLMSDWANIVTYGAVSGSGDDTAAIQDAMNSGKSIVYFPSGYYHVGATITVPATVKTIYGLSSTLTRIGTNFNDSANPQDVFRVQEADGTPLTIRGFWVMNIPGGIMIRHKANRVVVMRDCEGWVQTDPGVGKLFLENVCVTLRLAANAGVWARQLNMETTLAPAMASNDGANLWVLGIKSEKPNTIIDTFNGGATEVLGGMLSLNDVQPTDLPAFIVDNSRGSFSYGERTYYTTYTFTIHLSETRGTTTQNILRTDLPSRGNGKMMVLGSAFQATGGTVNDDNAAITWSGTWTDSNSAAGRLNGDEHYCNVTGNYAQFTFTGTTVTWLATKSSVRGNADVYIDNVFQQTVDQYSAASIYQQQLYVKGGLSSGQHTIKVVCKGTKNPSSTGYYIDVDAFVAGSPLMANDDSAAVTYSGTWTDNNAAAGRYNGDEHYSNVTSNYALFTFTGTAVGWIATKSTNRGNADVYIDNIFIQTVDQYASSSVSQQQLYMKAGLAAGQHTIKVVCRGTKNAASSGYYIDADAFSYYP